MYRALVPALARKFASESQHDPLTGHCGHSACSVFVLSPQVAAGHFCQDSIRQLCDELRFPIATCDACFSNIRDFFLNLENHAASLHSVV